MAFSYDSPEWRSLSASFLSRSSGCIVGRLSGGGCRGPLHAHHVLAVEERPDLALDEENLVAVCAGHHPMLEAFRRFLRRAARRDLPRCPHRHPTAEGRRACERKLARARGIPVDDLAEAA
jgi:hypothetical protein